MEAHEVKYGVTVVIIDKEVKTPPSSIPVNTGDEITIRRLDGMYCNAINKDGERIYIAAWTKVKELK